MRRWWSPYWKFPKAVTLRARRRADKAGRIPIYVRRAPRSEGDSVEGFYEDGTPSAHEPYDKPRGLCLDRRLSVYGALETLIHELLHLMIDFKGVPRDRGRFLHGEERVVRVLAEGLADLLIQNPNLATWIRDAAFASARLDKRPPAAYSKDGQPR